MQHKDKKDDRKLSRKSERPNEQFTTSKEKIYRILPIKLGDSTLVVGS